MTDYAINSLDPSLRIFAEAVDPDRDAVNPETVQVDEIRLK